MKREQINDDNTSQAEEAAPPITSQPSIIDKLPLKQEKRK